ncbi:MAG TPA: hypothetical protein VIJ57_05635 [Hanamia sp.]
MSNITDEEIEKLAIEENKKGWGQLFLKGNDTPYGKFLAVRPFPVKFWKQIDLWVSGYKAAIQQNKVSDPATEQSTSNWGKVGDKDKFMDEVTGRESVSDENMAIWIKGSDELPPINEPVVFREFNGELSIDSSKEWDKTEVGYYWLKPITEYASIIKGRKDNVGVNEAIEFTEWITSNGHEKIKNKWFTYNGTVIADTTQELYEQFKHPSQPQKNKNLTK